MGGTRRISRRELLGLIGAAGGGLALGGGGYLLNREDSVQAARRVLPFHGTHQGGVTTPQQKHAQFAAFDLQAATRDELRSLLRRWSSVAAALTGGEDSRIDDPAHMTVTLGLGPSLFDERFGLAEQRPPALIDIPPFKHDELVPERSGGDLGVQVCADDKAATLVATRAMVKAAKGAATVRWTKVGFIRDPLPGEEGGTPRNLFGFKDGTNNLKAADAERMRRNVWVDPADGPSWMGNGTYLVARQIDMDVDGFLAEPVAEGERAIGRMKGTGAPLGQQHEHDPVIPLEQPVDTHIMTANPRKPGSEDERILRRSYNFSTGFDPSVSQPVGGLMFLCFQRDPRRQFVPIQRRLAHGDRLQHHLFPRGSAIFAVPPGASAGGYVGETLLG
jgi:deferrochelatase/peroxidase EfeB